MGHFNLTRQRKKYNLVIFILLLSSGAFSQEITPKALDSIVSSLLSSLNNHIEIDRDIAIKYLHLDSILLQPDNAMIHSDSTFSFGSHIFWIVTYAGVVNCEYKRLIEYRKELRVFTNHLLLASSCDFDASADHTMETDFKIKDNMLYLYKNYYKIKNESLVLVKKQSRYSVFRFPDLTPVVVERPLQ